MFAAGRPLSRGLSLYKANISPVVGHTVHAVARRSEICSDYRYAAVLAKTPVADTKLDFASRDSSSATRRAAATLVDQKRRGRGERMQELEVADLAQTFTCEGGLWSLGCSKASSPVTRHGPSLWSLAPDSLEMEWR